MIRGVILFLFLVLSSSGSLSAAEDVCEQPGLHQDILKMLQVDHQDEETLLALSTAYQALGVAEKALNYADLALELNPKSGSAMVAKVHAVHLGGDVDAALELAKLTYFREEDYQYGRGERSWLRHSILAMLMAQEKLKEAEMMILREFPDVLSLSEKEYEPLSLDFGLPLHTLEALIHIYRHSDRGELADSLARHLQGFSAETFFESTDQELAATQNWMLASIWAGIQDKRAVPALTMAYEKGFRLGWRFNYPHHPVYWPYRNNANFHALISNIESDIAAQARCLR